MEVEASGVPFFFRDLVIAELEEVAAEEFAEETGAEDEKELVPANGFL
jgi:hypothetical protein